MSKKCVFGERLRESMGQNQFCLFAKSLVLWFSLQFACHDAHKLKLSYNPGERSLIIPCWRFTDNNIQYLTIIQYLIFPLLRLVCFCFFNTPATYFLKYFRAKCGEILTSGSREKCVFPKKLFRIQSHFLTYYACAAFNWVLSFTKKNENCWVPYMDTFFNIPL